MTQDFYDIFSPHIPSKSTQPENQSSEKFPFSFFFLPRPEELIYSKQLAIPTFNNNTPPQPHRQRDTEVVPAALRDIQSLNYPRCVWNKFLYRIPTSLVQEEADDISLTSQLGGDLFFSRLDLFLLLLSRILLERNEK